MELDMIGVSVILGVRDPGLEPLRGLEKDLGSHMGLEPMGEWHTMGCMCLPLL